jgi:hypothetical protein
MTTLGWLEWRILQSVLLSYERAGFRLRSELPDSGADLILSNSSQVTVVQVKNSANSQWAQRPYPDLDEIRVRHGADSAQLDVVWRPITRLVTEGDIEARITSGLLAKQDAPEAAYLLIFAAIEAALLRIASMADELPGQMVLGEIAVAVRDAGLIDEDQLEQIVAAADLRNGLAHGAFYNQTVTTNKIDDVANLARRLTAALPSKAATLLDEACKAAVPRPSITSVHSLSTYLRQHDSLFESTAMNYAMAILDNLERFR